MTGHSRRPKRVLTGSAAMLIAFTLSGCGEGGGFQLPSMNVFQRGDASDTAQSVQLVARDVEAPDVFQVTDMGIWDGEPSFAGIWVSYPNVAENERVIIRNTANGTFVIGALLPGAPENPDAPLQISSDAANTLGMGSGVPSELEVTALRREDPSETQDPVVTPASDTADAASESDAPDLITSILTDVQTGAPMSASRAASDLDRPFIQIGLFSREDNAQDAADRMRSAGIIPTLDEQTIQGRSVWRVLVGPARSDDERAQILAQVKSQGFDDAFYVTN